MKDLYQEFAAQGSLPQCIMHNPFLTMTPDYSCRTPKVVQLASVIYEDRAFNRLPILGAALDEAGCANAEVLAHCRKPCEDVRRC
jgi:hypothetical protein